MNKIRNLWKGNTDSLQRQRRNGRKREALFFKNKHIPLQAAKQERGYVRMPRTGVEIAPRPGFFLKPVSFSLGRRLGKIPLFFGFPFLHKKQKNGSYYGCETIRHLPEERGGAK